MILKNTFVDIAYNVLVMKKSWMSIKKIAWK